MLKKIATCCCLAGSLLLAGARESRALSWQEVLQQAGFDICDTFDELQDWTPGGRWYSGAGCCSTEFPKKTDGSGSIWSLWNNKGLSFQYTPGNGTFAAGDQITGATSGTTATVRRVWQLEGKSYLQLTYDNTVQGSSGFQPGEGIGSGSKSGTNLQWPLFIADHGPDHTWRRSGKSLVLDLGDNDNTDPADPTMAGLGAQRMAAFFGDGASGKSGYRKIHAFFMMKVAPTFFTRCLPLAAGCVDGGYDPVSVVKVFDLDSGFTGVSQWGTPAERAQVSTNPTTQARLPEYGLNFSIFNFNGGGLTFPGSLFFAENNYVASGSAPSYAYTQVAANKALRSGTALDIDSFVGSGEWFGLEAASDIGTVGESNGSTDFWIYDRNGVEQGHYVVTGQNRLMHFDHYYNKFVLGGNRLSGSGKTGGVDVRWWIDDVIIDGSRIGPAYFQLFPKITSFSAPETSNSRTVGGLALLGSSPQGEAALSYLVTQSGTPPAPGAAGWGSPAPTSYTVASDGPYRLYAWAKDGVGNVSFPVASKTVLVDSTAPRLTLASVTHANGLSSELTGTVSDAGGGVTVQVKVGSAAAADAVVAAGSWRFTAIGLQVGENAVTVTATDALSNKTTATGSILVDQTPPQLTLAQVDSPTKLSSQLLTGTVSDAGGVQSVTVQIGGAAAVAASITGNSWSYATPALADGPSSVTVTAYDLAGNRTGATISFVVDTVPPRVSLDSSVASQTLLSHLSLAGAVSDVGAGGGTISIQVGDTAVQPITILGSSWSYPSLPLPVSTTPTTITITAQDAAGNRSQQVTTQITRMLAGDTDGDGAVGVEDAFAAAQVWAGVKSPDQSQRQRMDIAPIVGGVPRPNGIIDTGDAVAILGVIVGINNF